MIDPQRHLTVFDPYTFNPTQVHIVGCGAAGSKTALSVAKLGVANIHLWDGDTVEEHNIANQAFGIQDIGHKKVTALGDIIKNQTGTVCHEHEKMIEGKEEFDGVVFLMVDSMKAREEIFDTSLDKNFRVKQVIEIRMGADLIRSYCFTPFNPGEVKGWKTTLYADDEAETSACGASVSVGPTTDLVAGLAVWQLIEWARDKTPPSELIYCTAPATVLTSQFNTF